MELWVEGPTDAQTRGRGAQPEDRPVAAGGALVPLVRKALAAMQGMSASWLDRVLPADRIEALGLRSAKLRVQRFDNAARRRQLSKDAWKVLAAIDHSRLRSPDTLILAVWDRDGKEECLHDRKAILDILRGRGDGGAAVGVCVEEIEAWLLADAAAFKRAFGRGPTTGLPGKPEDLAEPKEVLQRVLADYADAGQSHAFNALYHKLAQEIDLDTLTETCPRGFGELRKALEEFIAPHLRDARA